MSLSESSKAFLDGLRAAFHSVELSGKPMTNAMGGTICLIGNGGSAAICSHIAADMVKRHLNARVLTDAAVLTCMANDEGYDQGFAQQINRILPTWLIAVSSSGKSSNILEAVKEAHYCQTKVITFSGFDADNPLRSMGQSNYYVPSHNYGIVEITHLAVLHSIINPGI